MATTILDLEQHQQQTPLLRRLRIAERRAKLAKLAEALDKRCINRYKLARDIGLGNPDRIYKILNGTLPAPVDFIETVCGWTAIPYKDVSTPEDYAARQRALRDDMHEEDAERMGY